MNASERGQRVPLRDRCRKEIPFPVAQALSQDDVKDVWGACEGVRSLKV